MNNAMSRHISNMSKLSGGNGENARYNYIINTDDLITELGRMHNDLSYDLAIDSRYKRAIIYNKSGLEKAIYEAVNKCVIDALEEMGRSVANDVVNDIVYQMNGLIQLSNNTIVLGKGSASYSSLERFAKMLVKGVVKEVGKIIDDTINGEDKRK